MALGCSFRTIPFLILRLFCDRLSQLLLLLAHATAAGYTLLGPDTRGRCMSREPRKAAVVRCRNSNSTCPCMLLQYLMKSAMLPIVRRSQGAISMLVRPVHVMASFPSSAVRDCHMRLHNNNKDRTTSTCKLAVALCSFQTATCIHSASSHRDLFTVSYQ